MGSLEFRICFNTQQNSNGRTLEITLEIVANLILLIVPRSIKWRKDSNLKMIRRGDNCKNGI